MNVCVGDTVQIVNGGIDVTNGNRAKSGRYYGEGGPLWATVESITNGWGTGSRWGLPSSVIKVRCSAGGVVVWQVQPEHISSASIKSSEPEKVQTKPDTPPVKASIDLPETNENWDDRSGHRYKGTTNTYTSKDYYAPKVKSELWTESGGVGTNVNTTDALPSSMGVSTKIVTDREIFNLNTSIAYPNATDTFRKQTAKENKSIGSKAVLIDPGAIRGSVSNTSWQDDKRRRQMLNMDDENIVNAAGFPLKAKDASGLIAAKYSYQIIPSDPALPQIITLEDKLSEARAVFGLPVHGSNMIAKSMKYYMYNRFKTPDLNLAHNKSTTHVFFTRPDLNILKFGGGANAQTINHSETAMIWRRYPELFKLLTDCERCNDKNNFNMLLSNQCASFDIQDENLTENRAGKSWNEYEMIYGDAYSGRTGGDFTCNFAETSDYSVINLLKLWITYIDNVARGAWSPSYSLRNNSGNINASHVFKKTLDYASSVYVFKCGPDGEDIIYWTKYFGVFPMNTGVSALSWDVANPIGDPPKLNIKFGYSWKKDLSPISLIEFNNIAKVANFNDATSESSFNVNLGHSARPYVGAPFIEMKIGNTLLESDSVDHMRNRTELRLKFQKTANDKLTDDLLYRYSMSGRGHTVNINKP